MQLTRHTTAKREPNLIGLINIIFLLLVFFLVTGTLNTLPHASVDPIRTAEANPAEAPDDFIIIDDQSVIWLNGAIADEDTLRSFITTQQTADEEQRLMVVASRTLSVEGLRGALGQLQTAGARNVRLLTVE